MTSFVLILFQWHKDAHKTKCSLQLYTKLSLYLLVQTAVEVLLTLNKSLYVKIINVFISALHR